KDSMSMTQKYPNDVVYAPGTVIISASGEVSDVRMVVEPVLENDPSKPLLWVDFSFTRPELGGSALAQTLGRTGVKVPHVRDTVKIVKTDKAVQQLYSEGVTIPGDDFGSGGLLTTLLELCFADNHSGLDLALSAIGEQDTGGLL